MFKHSTVVLKERRKYHHYEFTLGILRISFYKCRSKWTLRTEISNWDK